MAITTYTELQTAVENWLNRTDLDSRIPEFIALAEADIRRVLRSDTVIAALMLDSDAVALPAAVGELRSVRYDDSTRKYPLKQTTVDALATLRRTGSGYPHYYAVADQTLLLDIEPSSDFTAEIVYFEKLVALSAGAPSNDTLTNSPDIYLFGALKEAEPYLEHDERNIMWSQKYQKAVNDENTARERRELGAAPVARLPIVLG